jgi:ATP-binding cassette subfamily B protein
MPKACLDEDLLRKGLKMTSTEKKTENKTAWRDLARYTFHYWKPNKVLGISAMGLTLMSVVADVGLPVYTGRIVDAMTGVLSRSSAEHEAAVHAAWAAFIGFGLMAFLLQVLRIASMFLWNIFAMRGLYAIVNDGLRKVQRFSSDWHANAFAGGTVRKITRGMWSFDVFEDVLVMHIIPAVAIMIGMTVMLWLSLPTLGLAAALLILLYFFSSIWMSVKLLAPRFRASADADTKVGAALADVITGNATVKAFAAEQREDGLFRTVTDTWRRKSLHAWHMGVTADGARSALRVFMTVGMVGATIWLWQNGKATPGDITLVLTTFMIIGGYLRDIGQHIAHLQRSASEMEDIVGFWLRNDDVADIPDAKPLTVSKDKHPDIITFSGVGFKYPSADRWIYRDMSVGIKAGEKLALVGISGSGKSTFVKLIQRLYNVTEGQILIDGQDIAQVTMESLRRSVALVPQDPVLFHRSLSENIAYGKPGASMDEIIAAAKKAHAHDFIATLPLGYNTLVGERGIKLSGGERQRVAIARAILADAPILILDEATSSLDSLSEHYIQEALEALTAGRTTLTIAHRLSTIQKADRILVFDGGKIIEQGSHAALMAQPSRYKMLYDMQALDLAPEEKVALI